jgi:hypothetical protein
VQPELGMHFLLDFKIQNFDILKDIPVDLNEYGKCDFAGIRDGEPEAVPVLWDERREVYTDSWEAYNAIPQEEIEVRDYPDHVKRVSTLLPKPKTLLDIVNFGIDNLRFSNSALAEIMHQLYKSDKHKVMFLIDEYNEWFRPSVYDSYKYANYKGYNTKIPPMDLALVRLFMKFDGHFIKQGVKVFSTSMRKYQKASFKPEDIRMPKGYSVEVENLKLNDFRNACYYYIGSGFVDFKLDEFDIQDAFDITQGNWDQLHKHIQVPIDMKPMLAHYLSRKARNKEILNAKKI